MHVVPARVAARCGSSDPKLQSDSLFHFHFLAGEDGSHGGVPIGWSVSEWLGIQVSLGRGGTPGVGRTVPRKVSFNWAQLVTDRVGIGRHAPTEFFQIRRDTSGHNRTVAGLGKGMVGRVR